jgi:signal transduction histidine kinase/ligand-binding sensor domain-containing protein
MRTIFQLLIILVWTSPVTRAAENDSPGWVYRTWQTEDGLPDNAVSGVVQSADAYLWVATKGGLQRFNGKEFEPVPMARYSGLRSVAIRAMCLDRRGELWIATERGPVIRLGARQTRVFSEDDGIPPTLMRRILEDREGSVWLVMQEKVVKISGGRVEAQGPEQGLPALVDPSAATDGDGNVWLAGKQRLGVMRDGRFQRVRVPAPGRMVLGDSRSGGPWLAVDHQLMKLPAAGSGEPERVGTLPEGTEPEVLFEDGGGALWIGTRQAGLWRWAKGAFEQIPTSDSSIESLFEDRQGNLWVGTSGGGLNLLRRRVAAMHRFPGQLPFPSAISVCEDGRGMLWAVGAKGELAVRGADGWKSPPGFTARATCITAGRDRGVMVGTRADGLWEGIDGKWRRVDRAGDLPGSSVRSVMRSAKGDLWIATNFPNRLSRLRDGAFVTLEGPPRMGAIRALEEDAAGRIWAGSASGEVLRAEGGRLVPVVVPDATRPLLSVRDLHATADGSLWIAFAGDGIGWIKNGEFRRITTAHGLRDDFVSQLLVDSRGAMWIAANRGLFEVKVEELLDVVQGTADRIHCRAHGRGEALPSLQPSRNHSPSSCRLSDGRLCFAMLNGLLMVSPGEIREETEPPPVVLEEVSLDGKTRARYGGEVFRREDEPELLPAPADRDFQLEVPPVHEQLMFRFAALTYGSPENVQFRYRLKGLENEWIWTQDDTRVRYPRLPAGTYEFEVAASNSNGRWSSPGTRVRVRVHPFFWETWWFRIGGGVATVLVTAGVVFLAARTRHRRQLRELRSREAIEQERARIARDIHDELGASLTRISLLSRPPGTPVDRGSAGADSLSRIHEISQQLVRAMGEVIWAVTPRNDSLDALANYLGDYAREFLALAEIRCRLDVPLELPSRELSAKVRHNVFLAFKESLNNVVKHAAAREVRIRFIPGPEGFELWVEDDGRGIPAPSGRGHGLGNMQDRMAEIGGTCEVSQAPGGGGRIVFKVRFHPDPPVPSRPPPAGPDRNS